MFDEHGVNVWLAAEIKKHVGIPVATVALSSSGPANAAILAAEILALSDEALAKALADARRAGAEKVSAKDAALQEKL